MGLSDLVRGAIKTAHKVTGDLQEEITLHRWRAQTDTGKPTYASALTLTAIVHHKGSKERNAAGQEVTRHNTHVIFLDPIPALSPAVTGREEPIDKRDKIVFANGSTGPILRTDGGLADRTTNAGYITQCWLG